MDKLIVLSNSVDLASEICGNLGVTLYTTDKTVFANNEIKVKIPVNVREHTVFYIHTFENGTKPLESYGELWFVNDALRRASAEKIINVLPYMAYTRGDRKDETRVAIPASVIAKFTQLSGANRIITTDLHSGQIQGFCEIPFDNLYADKLVAEHIVSKEYPVDNMVVGAPDYGASKRAESLAERLGGLDIIIMQKKRPADEHGRPIPNKPEVVRLIGDVCDKYVLFFDDIIDTGSTLVEAAKAVKEKGALGVYAAATHGIFSPRDGRTAEEKLFEEIESIIVTNTIPQEKHPKKEVVTVAELYKQAIERTYKGDSLSELFG